MLPGSSLRERWEKVRLDDLLDGLSPIEFTLRFTLSNPDLDTTIVGTRDPGHLHANIDAALKGPLPESVVEEAKRRLAEAGSRPAHSTD
jgi:aryl-alcohol dehydrogenase-like predicted oxidoreductase